MRKNTFVIISTLVLSSVVFSSSTTWAGSADLQLSSDAVRGSLELPIGSMAAVSSYTVGYQKDKGSLGAIGFYAVDPNFSRRPLQTGIGVKAYTVNLTQPGRVGAFAAISGFVRGETALGVGGELELAYSPTVLSFMKDASSMVEGQARLTYRLMQQATVFIGYSGGTVSFDKSKIDFEDSINLGFRMNF